MFYLVGRKVGGQGLGLINHIWESSSTECVLDVVSASGLLLLVGEGEEMEEKKRMGEMGEACEEK